MRYLLICLLACMPAAAQTFTEDILILGEVHDNPAHHLRQAEIVERLQPKALVFEMLTAEQAAAHIAGADAVELETALGWADSGWPDFAIYYPIFAAAPEAQVFGAHVPRARARAAMEQGLAEAFGEGAEALGLTRPLPSAEQSEREAMQMAAHCDALPESLLPGMVNIQRLRDATLAQVALDAFDQTGGPVVIITGNGHARADWGIPVYIERAAPERTIFTLGQGEAGQAPQGSFTTSEATALPVDRPDPCAAFK